MNDMELKNKLLSLGFDNLNADLLIKSARDNKVGVSRALVKKYSGIYTLLMSMIVLYFFFICNMDKREFILFSMLYLSIVIITFLATDFFKELLRSFRVLILLRGK